MYKQHSDFELYEITGLKTWKIFGSIEQATYLICSTNNGCWQFTIETIFNIDYCCSFLEDGKTMNDFNLKCMYN